MAVGPPIPPRWVQNSEASVLLLKSAPGDGGTSIGPNPAKVQLRRYGWKSRGQKSHPPIFDRSGAPDTQQPASDRKGSRRSEHTSDGLPCSLFTPAPGLERLSTSPFVHTGCIRPTSMEQLVHESSLRLTLPPAATSWWRSSQKEIGKVNIDPSRRRQRLSTGDCGNLVDDRGGRPCRTRFVGVCDSLHAAAPVEPSGGSPRDNNDDHDRNSSRYRRGRHSQRTLSGEKQPRRVSASSAPARGLDKPIAIMRRLITLRVVDCLSQSPLRIRPPTVCPVGVFDFLIPAGSRFPAD